MALRLPRTNLDSDDLSHRTYLPVARIQPSFETDLETWRNGCITTSRNVGAVDGIAGYESRGKQDSAQKATSATKVQTVDSKTVPDNKEVAQKGRQATVEGEPVTIR